MTDNLSPALVRRLPQYFRALIKFYGSGKERISSEDRGGFHIRPKLVKFRLCRRAHIECAPTDYYLGAVVAVDLHIIVGQVTAPGRCAVGSVAGSDQDLDHP